NYLAIPTRRSSDLGLHQEGEGHHRTDRAGSSRWRRAYRTGDRRNLHRPSVPTVQCVMSDQPGNRPVVTLLGFDGRTANAVFGVDVTVDEIYTLSLHDALPIYGQQQKRKGQHHVQHTHDGIIYPTPQEPGDCAK